MLKVAEHSPGQRLLLERAGFPWRVPVKIVLSLFFLPFALAPILPLAAAIVGNESFQPEDPAAYIVMVVFSLFWYACLLVMIWLASLFTREDTWVELDRHKNALTKREVGRMLWLSKTQHLPFDRIERATVKVRGNDGHSIRLRWSFARNDAASNNNSLSVVFHADGVDERAKAIALSHDMARVFGFAGRRVERSDHLETELTLLSVAEGDDVEPIPAIDKTVSDDADAESAAAPSPRKLAEAAAPEIEVGPFDPDSFKVALRQLVDSKIEWQPGEHVRLYTGALPIGWRIAATLGLGALAGVVLSVVCVGGILKELGAMVGLEVPLWQWGCVMGVAVASLSWHRLGRLYGEREAIFDWASQTAHLRIRGRKHDIPFDQIQSLAVQGYHEHRSDHPDKYFCDVFLVLGSGEQRIITSESRNDRDAVYRESAALAAELAEHLGVTWQWRGYRRRGGIERLFKLDR